MQTTKPASSLDFIQQVRTCEWPTIALWLGCYIVWGLALFVLPSVSAALAFGVLTLTLVLQSSLSHELLHGHPFASQRINTALGLLAVGLFIPYLRFRDTHLAHHIDERLTDPYDDPETNYLDPVQWQGLGGWRRRILQANNTLLGRMVIGPLIGQCSFMRKDWQAIQRGERRVLIGWAAHLPATALTLICVWAAPMSIGAYVGAAYGALGILKIRTFLEHQAKNDPSARTVIVEGRGLLSFLFLNNNLHVVHHLHPNVAWHMLPRLYRENAATYHVANEGYVYSGYGAIFRKHLLRAKDPVAHPLWPSP